MTDTNKQPLIVDESRQKKLDLKLIGLQLLMFAITFINYAALHATRSIWSSATKDFIREFNFTKYDVASMNSTYLTCYAVCGIFTGQLADKF